MLEWLILLGILLFLYIKSGQLALLCGALILFMIPWVSKVWNRVILKSADKPGIQILENGKKGGVSTLMLQVPVTRFPVLGTYWCKLFIQNELTGEVQEIFTSFEAGKASFPVPHCGRYLIRMEQLWLTDYLGIFPKRIPCEIEKRMTVMPETFPVELNTRLLLSAVDDSDLYESDRKGNDPTEIFQLREYVSGDPVRSIHWKLSSKLDNLIMKEAAMPVDRSLLIYWNQSTGSAPVMDTLAEAVFSLCQALSEQGYTYTLGWPEKGAMQMVAINHMDDLLEHLPLLLHKKEMQEEEDGQFQSYGKIMYFTGALTAAAYGTNVYPFLCLDEMKAVEGATVFTPDNYKEKIDFSYEY